MPGDFVIHEERASRFFGAPLIARLRRSAPLIIFGESTSGCVGASTPDAIPMASTMSWSKNAPMIG